MAKQDHNIYTIEMTGEQMDTFQSFLKARNQQAPEPLSELDALRARVEALTAGLENIRDILDATDEPTVDSDNALAIAKNALHQARQVLPNE